MPHSLLYRTALFIATCLGAAFAVTAREHPDGGAASAHPTDFDAVQWQSAEPADMALFKPYLGTFRGKTLTADDGTEFYFTVTYEWFDRDRTILKYTLRSHVPSRDQERVFGEGHYRYDWFTGRIAVTGIFRDGRSGTGYVTPFDTRTHEREVRIHSRDAQGVVSEVRDTFWVIDENSWGNRTYVSTDGGDWRVVSEGVYTRVES